MSEDFDHIAARTTLHSVAEEASDQSMAFRHPCSICAWRRDLCLGLEMKGSTLRCKDYRYAGLA